MNSAITPESKTNPPPPAARRDALNTPVEPWNGAIDCGLAVSPGNVENQISGQLVQTVSRMLKEEVTFNKTNVTSLDWNSYPILRFQECPEVIPIVVQRVNEKSTGAGEEVMAAAAAAFANAFFDATGVRLRGYPFSRKRVLAALTSRRAGI